MVAKTYEAISDAFDFEIRKNNYVNIVKKNAETFWNYKHNYIIDKLESSKNNIEIGDDLREQEDVLGKIDEQSWVIPMKVIEKIVNLNYWDITTNESELISYLQENTVNDSPNDVLNFVFKTEQYFTYILKCYKDLSKWIIDDVDKEPEYKPHPEIKETEFESRERSIKKWLWTLCNVIVNEAISYDLDSISEISWISREDIKNFMTKDTQAIQNKELLDNLHRFILRMQHKYSEYSKRYIWIAEWKEYEDSELWIKDFSDIELPAEDKNILERKVHKSQIEEIERDQEKEELKKKKNLKKESVNENDDEEENKGWLSKIKNRFK